jgi:hypothetical protein
VELKEFVSEVLQQIVMGVKSAQEVVASTGGAVNPAMDSGTAGTFDRRSGTPIQNVHFDVALSTAEGTKTKGGIGVVVATFALGSQGQSEASTSSLSRITFSVPLLLPPASTVA